MLLSMSCIASKLHFAGNESAIKWLRNKNVPLWKFGKNLFCYQLDFDQTVTEPFVKQIINENPADWEDALQEVIPNEVLLKTILRKLKKSKGINYKKKTFKTVLATNEREQDTFSRLDLL